METTPHKDFGWDDVQRLADELELKVHLAGMEVRDRWVALKPRVVDLERKLAAASNRASHAIAKELSALGDSLRELRDDLK